MEKTKDLRKTQSLPNRVVEFTSFDLEHELYRLKDIFLPEFKVPKISIEVGGRTYSKAAVTYYNQNKIVMFKPYHDRFPEEYKMTLLHELGHIVADHSHGENFKKYFMLLRDRQRKIEEQVIPCAYADFLFSKVCRHYTRRYYCAHCQSQKLYRKRMRVTCGGCQLLMLEDYFFDGIEAILPSEFKASVNRSIVGLDSFSADDVIC